MTTTMHSEQFLRKRQFLLVMPLLVLPFLTLLFWVLDGGKGSGALAQAPVTHTGLNMELPAANLKDDAGWTKMDYYKQADQDSAKRLEQIKRDPYYNLPVMTTSVADTNPLLMIKDRPVSYQPNAAKSIFSGGSPEDAQEAKVQQKLKALERELHAPSTTSLPVKPRKRNNRVEAVEEAETSPEMRQLQNMMAEMNATASEPDAEMQEISKVLDKLMDVQHPERVQDKIKEQSAKNKGVVYPVSLTSHVLDVSVLEQPRMSGGKADTLLSVSVASNGFYSLEDEMVRPTATNAIPAVIHEDQTLVAGATVKLRLTYDIYIQGVLIPRDTYIYGEASLSGERLNIAISGIQYANGLYPVALSVYDLDGMPGINIPGAITRDVAKQSADQSLQQIGMNSLDPTIGMQAASAGIEVTKTLLSKKVKLVKVMVKAGYQVLLKDTQTK